MEFLDSELLDLKKAVADADVMLQDFFENGKEIDEEECFEKPRKRIKSLLEA